MTYGAVTEAMYRQRLALYADAGMTLLRVWGRRVSREGDVLPSMR